MAVETIYDNSIGLNKRKNNEEVMEHDGTSKTIVLGKKPEKISPVNLDSINSNSLFPKSFEIDGNVQIGTAIKKAVKKHKKQQRKIGKIYNFKIFKFIDNRTSNLTESLSATNIEQMDYDFSVLE